MGNRCIETEKVGLMGRDLNGKRRTDVKSVQMIAIIKKGKIKSLLEYIEYCRAHVHRARLFLVCDM